jgi:hypothetical protein
MPVGEHLWSCGQVFGHAEPVGMIERRSDAIVVSSIASAIELSRRPTALQAEHMSLFEHLRAAAKNVTNSWIDVRLVAWTVAGMLMGSHRCQHQDVARVGHEQRRENLSIESAITQVPFQIVEPHDDRALIPQSGRQRSNASSRCRAHKDVVGKLPTDRFERCSGFACRGLADDQDEAALPH